MYKEDFDYYVFMDYSENLIGYVIIDKKNVNKILNKIIKLKHYKKVKHKTEYLNSMKKLFKKNKILETLTKYKITELRQNIEICSEIFDFCKKKPKSKIFISVDDRQYCGFMRIASFIDGKRLKIVKEGRLKKDSLEHKMSLIIDTLLNLKRIKQRK